MPGNGILVSSIGGSLTISPASQGLSKSTGTQHSARICCGLFLSMEFSCKLKPKFWLTLPKLSVPPALSVLLPGVITHSALGRRREQIADLDRMLNLLDGKPVSENRNDLPVRLDAHISKQHASVFEDECVEIRYFQKGTGHITFKRPNLVGKMNGLIVKLCPGRLSSFG
jgi:hypothetical protein